MSRSRLMRSHSIDGFLRRTPSTCFSDPYHDYQSSSAWDRSDGLYDYDYAYDYDSGYSQQQDNGYEQSSTWNDMQDSDFQRQPTKQNRVTWGAMPKYSSDRDRNRLSNHFGNETSSTRESIYSRARSPFRSSSRSDCPIHGHSSHDHSTLNRNHLESSLYGSQLYPSTNSRLYTSNRRNSSTSSSYYPSSSKPLTDYGFNGSSRYSSRSLPGRYSSFSYLRNPLLDSAYYPTYSPLSRDQIRSMLTPQFSNFLQRPKRPKWRRSILGLNRLSLHG